jgi:thiamine-phosphate pyrophosphorylase
LSREEEWIDPAEAGLRVILFAPGAAVGEQALVEVLAAGPVAALVLDPAGTDGAERDDLIGRWREACRAAGTALLLRGDARLAARTGADGVHLDDAQKVREARGELGATAIVGAGCGVSRHAAMVAGEAGADYVMFGAVDRPVGTAPDDPGLHRLVGLARWWGELFVIPCAVAGAFPTAAVPALGAAGADFLGLGASVWGHPAGAAPAMREFARAIGAAPRRERGSAA